MPDKSSKATEAFLYGRINYERAPKVPRKTCLERMRQLSERLGHPQDQTPIVHIAGTKGKGSTAIMVAEVLRAAGLRVGMYCSPHLQAIEERILVDGQPIASSDFEDIIEGMRPIVEEMDRDLEAFHGRGPTFFELVTAAAFECFRRQQLDVAVIEVGMGGRLDSTNVCQPMCSVITNISLDHTAQLGTDEPTIAREKAGIIKPRTPVITGTRHPGALGVIAEMSRQHESPLMRTEYDYFATKSGDGPQTPAGFRIRYSEHRNFADLPPWSFDSLALKMLGAHQIENAATAIAVSSGLRNRFRVAIDESAVRRGLGEAQLPARFEITADQPLTILDGAHNDASISALVNAAKHYWPDKKMVVVFAASKGKDVHGMLGHLCRHARRVICTRFTENPRAIDPATLAETARQVGSPEMSVDIQQRPQAAIEAAERECRPDELICVTGSMFLAAELRQIMIRGRQPIVSDVCASRSIAS